MSNAFSFLAYLHNDTLLIMKRGKYNDYDHESMIQISSSCISPPPPFFSVSSTIKLFPVRVQQIAELIQDVFGGDCEHAIYGDFQPAGVVDLPGYYQHVVKFSK